MNVYERFLYAKVAASNHGPNVKKKKAYCSHVIGLNGILFEKKKKMEHRLCLLCIADESFFEYIISLSFISIVIHKFK